MPFSQFLKEFGNDYRHEWAADQQYWETHELDWQEHLRDEYRQYCEDNGYEVVFD